MFRRRRFQSSDIAYPIVVLRIDDDQLVEPMICWIVVSKQDIVKIPVHDSPTVLYRHLSQHRGDQDSGSTFRVGPGLRVGHVLRYHEPLVCGSVLS